MRFTDPCYRGIDPRWAVSPTSGEGAKSKGARFNPAGVPALYLALSVEGVFVEMGHGFARRFDPLTVCSYEVDVEDVIDLRTDADRAREGVELGELGCAWALDLANGREPASWGVARRMIARGAAGIVVPSFARGATAGMHNLVLWKWGRDLPHRVVAHDPSGRLPRNQESWS